MPVFNAYMKSCKATIMKKSDKQTVREEALAKLLECSFREDTPLMMKNDNGVFALFFDTRSKGLSDFKYRWLWYAINQVVGNDDKNWMYRYWEFADQYYGDVFACASYCEEGKRFFEFHVAVGGLLALNEKYEWIKHIASFTNCLPAKYFLIPSTFSEIFDWLHFFDDMAESSIDLDVRYHLYSQYEGVRAGANLYKGIVRYLAMMMCRLPEMNFNVRYINPMALPHVYGDATDEKKDFVSVNLKNIRIADFLRKTIDEACRGNSGKEQALLLLRDYIDACRKRLNVDAYVDDDKIEHIAKTLLDEFVRQQSVLITSKDSSLESFVRERWFAESADALNEYDFLEGRSYNNINRESVMVRHIIVEAIFRYNEVLKTYQATTTLNVRYKDISAALTKLCIPKEYVILVGNIANFLLPDGYDDNPNVHFIYSNQSEIIILEKSLLPFICFEEEECKYERYKLIDEKKNKVLYSNIWQMQNAGETKLNAEKNKHFDLFIGCYASIYMPPKEKRRCIRIRAVDGITQETFDLDKTQKITHYDV